MPALSLSVIVYGCVVRFSLRLCLGGHSATEHPTSNHAPGTLVFLFPAAHFVSSPVKGEDPIGGFPAVLLLQLASRAVSCQVPALFEQGKLRRMVVPRAFQPFDLGGETPDPGLRPGSPRLAVHKM